jgi:hypothetical protein
MNTNIKRLEIMNTKNLSPQQMFIELAAKHIPECKFDSKSKDDFLTWKTNTLPKVLSTIGEYPQPAPLEPELQVEWKEDNLIKQRWIINVQEGLAATVMVYTPQGLKENEKRPAILCSHGHGPCGKDAVMGNYSSPEMRAEIELKNNDYGFKMAKKGFITYSLDWIGFNERRESFSAGKDWCNVFYLHATMLGMTNVSVNVAHGKATTDFILTLPHVDKDRLGVMGMSGGGTMALWMALCDERIKATEIICYSNLWEVFGYRDLNYCGMQVAPGLFKLVNLPDLQGLLAPRPLLLDIGVHDTCFRVGPAMKCYKQVSNIYKIAEASNMLELDLFPGEHGWGGNKSESFFKKHFNFSNL